MASAATRWAGSARSWPRRPTLAWGSSPPSSTPADPYRLTRLTFRLAHLPIPDPIAYPLAWLTTRVYLRPRGHEVADVSAALALADYRGPVLLAHGSEDRVVPRSHLERLAQAARSGRHDGDAPVETILVDGGEHSWLYEFPAYRRAVARAAASARRSAGARRGRRDRRCDPRRAHPRHRARVRRDRGRSRAERRRSPRSSCRARPAACRSPTTTPSPRPDERPTSPNPSGRPSGRKRAIRASPTARWNRPTSSGSSTPGVAPRAPRTSSAGRSSSAATAPTCASSAPSVRGPATSRGPLSGSPS